jgi:beta-xylosidase
VDAWVYIFIQASTYGSMVQRILMVPTCSFHLHRRLSLARSFLFLIFLMTGSLVSHAYGGQADLGNGTYRNPILFADYSDPDVIRVGTDYYLVASSFHFMPGLPILKSHDLVNWTIVGHVFPRLEMSPAYSMMGGNRYGQGAWAPAIRYHEGKFYVYFPTPAEGIFMSTSSSAEGPWTKPIAVMAQRGLEDPCPFWDDDGTAYLIHSRTGAGPLYLHKMSPDGKSVLDEGKLIVQNRQALPTLEGPKLYKRNGFYYIFAPYGGVATGSQVVLRSKEIYGPYEFRTVLAQGTTSVNGPHQGGYIETPNGEGWFLHFHSQGAYGRIDYLEPVKWVDNWPIIGKAIDGNTVGEPVGVWKKPDVGGRFPIQTPQTSDEFNSKQLGPQWEWNHNPDDAHWSLSERRGFIRLKAMPASDLIHARNTLTEMMQNPTFDLTARLDTQSMMDGQRAGLTMFSAKPSGIGVVEAKGKRRLMFFAQTDEIEGPALEKDQVRLRVHVEREMATYFYSVDEGRSFQQLGKPSRIYFSWWKAARPALFSFNTDQGVNDSGSVDVDWVHYQAVKDTSY